MNRQKHKLSRRILAVLLMAAMLITMLPSAMFAAPTEPTPANNGSGQGTTSVTKTENGVTVNKYVTGDKDSGYNLTVEAYASENLETTTNAEPLDIVLVLDMSGSMDEEFTDSTTSYNPVYELKQNETYYIKSGYWYQRVTYSNHHRSWGYEYREWYQTKWQSVEPKTSENDSNEDHHQFYTRTETAAQDKIDALKSAVGTFIDNVSQNAEENNIDHRVSIVKFAGNSSDNIGDDWYDEEYGLRKNWYNHSQTVVDLTNVRNGGAADLKDTVNELEPAGATRADYGMQHAASVLDNSDNDKVVVMFTDGTPTSSNEFSSTVADDAIQTAKTLKADGTSIYTVGIFQGANPQDDPTDKRTSNENKYMHAVSSNYPKAEAYDQLGDRAENSNYYFAAEDAAGLTGAFEDIWEDVLIGQLEAEPDAGAVLSDTLGKYFKFPQGFDGTENVSAKYVPAEVDKAGNITFNEDKSEDRAVSITVDGKDISITGFNYKDNVVSYNKDNNTVTGGKLVVTFPIEVDANACLTDPDFEDGWHDTNAAASLAYKSTADSEGNDDATTLLDSPQVEIDKADLSMNGTDVTVQIFVDGKEVKGQDLTNLLNADLRISRATGENDNYHAFNLVSTDENGILTYDFDYNPDTDSGHDCVDLGVTVGNKYVLQGVNSYQDYGKSGTKNVVDNSNGSYTIDNVTAVGNNNDPDCKIYLSTKYSVKYFNGENELTDAAHQDTTAYIAPATEIVKSTTGENDGPAANSQKWMSWKNPGYATSIAKLPALPTAAEGYTAQGWYLGSVDATETTYAPESSFGAINSTSDKADGTEDHVIEFYATSKENIPTPPDVAELLKDSAVKVICANEEANHYADFHEKTYGLLEGTYQSEGDVSLTQDGGYQYQIKITDLDAYVDAFNNEEQLNGVQHTKTNNPENTTITFNYSKDNGWALQAGWQSIVIGTKCENPAAITDFSKSVVTKGSLPEGVSAEDYTLPEVDKNGNLIAITATEGDKVKLLYAITVAGENTTFTVKDPGATLVDTGVAVKQDAETGYITGEFEGEGTLTFYVSKEFTVSNGMTELPNSAAVYMPNEEKPEKEDDSDVPVEVIPDGPSDQEVITAFGGIIKIDCDGGYYADKHTEALFALVKEGFDCTEPAKGDDGVYYVDVTVDPSKEYMETYVEMYNASKQSGGVETHTLIPDQQAQTLHLMYDAENEEWKMVGGITPILFKVTCPNPNDLESIEKTVISSKSDAIDAGIMGEYDYPVEGEVQVCKGENVTLLYKITVTGDAGATFKVTDKVGDIAAKLVSGTGIEDDGDGNFTGTIPENGESSFYVSMNFGEINESTTLHNAAKVDNTGDGDIPEEPESSVDVDVEVPPTIPTDEELEVMLDGKITVDCLNSMISPEHPDKVYGLVDEDHYKVSELTQTTDGKYTFTVELVTDEYIADYNKEIGKEHKLSSGGEYKFTLTWDGNKWIVKPDEGLVIKVECVYGITGIDKFLVADADQKEATGLTEDKLARFTFPDEKGRINLPKDGKVTLLYGITVTGVAGEEFTVTDENALLTPDIATTVENKDNGIFTGTIPEDGSITFYVEKVFTASDIDKDIVEGEESLVNVAEITEGDVVPGEKDDEEIVPVATGYSLTYEANGGYFANDAAKTTATVGELNPAQYDLWSDEAGTIPVDENGKELAKPIHAQAAPPEDTVISDADLVDVELIGWTTEVPESAGQIYAAGDKYPTLTDKATIEDDNVTVYAVWGYDENNDGVADATQVLITPADITAYTGGTPYGGIADINGDIITESVSGLPEPGYFITLPYDVQQWLNAQTGTTVGATNLHDYMTFTYKGTDGSGGTTTREWKLEYQGVYETDENGNALRYVYSLAPATVDGKEIPVRLNYFKDTNNNGKLDETETALTNDDILMSKDLAHDTFSMTINPGELDQSVIKAAFNANGDTKDSAVGIGTGTLTVKSVTDVGTTTNAIGNSESDVTENTLTAVANSDVTYYVNDSLVDVENRTDRVKLLVDSVSNNDEFNAQMGQHAIEAVEGSSDTHDYELAYMDLVDTANGNTEVTLGKGTLTIYWPMPENADPDGDFQVVHYTDMNREGTVSDLNEVGKEKLAVTKVTVNGKDYLTFEVSSFSPFALVYTADDGSDTPDYPDYPIWTPDGGDDGPSGLNTEDHFSYVVGYAEDYRTGEATDNEDLWPVKPNNQITRAEVATIFYRLLEDEVRDEYDTTTNDFSDVTADSWYNQTVSTLARMGIVKGYEDGSFRPNAPITRAEFGAIATRFFAETGATYEPGTFTDVTGDEWYANAIQDAVNLGLIGGYPDGTVRPNNNITRAEACAIVNRTLGRVPDADHLLPEDVMKVWPDNNPTDWFYADMQEATNGHEYAWIEEDGHEIEEWTNLLDKDWTDR